VLRCFANRYHLGVNKLRSWFRRFLRFRNVRQLWEINENNLQTAPTPSVRAILEDRWHAQGRPSEGWVFAAPTRSGHIEGFSLRKQHGRALLLSGVPFFVLYSIRHTFLTTLGASGCDAWTLARIAGHSSAAMSSRYVHPQEDTVLIAMERLGG